MFNSIHVKNKKSKEIFSNVCIVCNVSFYYIASFGIDKKLKLKHLDNYVY